MSENVKERIIHLEDLPGSFIIRLEDNFRKEWFTTLFKDGSKNLAKNVGISRSYVYHLKNGRHHFRLSLLKKIAEHGGIPLELVEKKVTEIISNRGGRIRIELPLQSSPEMASLIGHCFGDGSISTKKREFDYVNLDYARVLAVKELGRNVFKAEPTSEYQNKDGTYKIAFSSLIGEILGLFGATIGKKVETNLSVPDWIKNGDRNVKIAFLQALFDDDGSVLLSKNYAAKNVNLHFTRIESNDGAFVDYLNDIREMLLDLGIDSRKPYIARKYAVNGINRTVRGIYISDIANIAKFQKTIHFRQSEKKKRLDALLERFDKMPLDKGIRKVLVLGSGPIVIGQAAETCF